MREVSVSNPIGDNAFWEVKYELGSNAQSMATAALERKVCFSDESRFLLQRADGRARVHRGRNEPTNCIHQVDELLEAVL